MYFTKEKMEKIGIRIKEERQKLGLTQTELGLKLCVGDEATSRQTICNWEKGRIMPTIERFHDMCNQFDCELGYLLCEYDCKAKTNSDIHNLIGLSENSINILKQINSSHYRDTINTLSQLIEHPHFIDLLCDIHTHNIELNQKHYSTKQEQICNLATVLDCSLDKATEYIASSSKSLITSRFMQIIETLNNTPKKKKTTKRTSKPLFEPDSK